MSNERQYHLTSIWTNGRKTYLTNYPMTHKRCCTMKSKFTPHKDQTIMLEEVTK